MEGHQRTLWNDGNILYLAGNLGYMGVCICQNSANVLKICAFYCMQNLFQKKKLATRQSTSVNEVFKGKETVAYFGMQKK